MEIYVSKIENELKRMSTNLDEYQEFYLNLYKELNDIFLNWDDPNSKKIQSEVDKNKVETINNFNSIEELKDIYSFTVERYKEIGDKIQFDLSGRDKLSKKLNDCRNKINEISNLYNKLDLSLHLNETEILNSQKQYFYIQRKNISKIIGALNKKIDYIEETEELINSKLSKINISSVESSIDVS